MIPDQSVLGESVPIVDRILLYVDGFTIHHLQALLTALFWIP